MAKIQRLRESNNKLVEEKIENDQVPLQEQKDESVDSGVGIVERESNKSSEFLKIGTISNPTQILKWIKFILWIILIILLLKQILFSSNPLDHVSGDPAPQSQQQNKFSIQGSPQKIDKIIKLLNSLTGDPAQGIVGGGGADFGFPRFDHLVSEGSVGAGGGTTQKSKVWIGEEGGGGGGAEKQQIKN